MARKPARSSGRTLGVTFVTLMPRTPDRSSGRSAAGAGSANTNEATTTNAGIAILLITEFFTPLLWIFEPPHVAHPDQTARRLSQGKQEVRSH
jgi:hypothetical protein